jgi:hypothetical membrane protein
MAKITNGITLRKPHMADLKCYAGKCGHGLSLVCISTLAGMLAPVIFLVVMAIVESIQPGYNPFQDFISNLSLGALGWFHNLSYFLFGSLFAVFTLRLCASTFRTITARVGMALFLMCCISFFVLGVFPPDLHKPATTVGGHVHYWAAFGAVVTFISGCSAFAWLFRKDKRWNKYWRLTVVTAVLCLGFSLLWKFSPSNWEMSGLFERLFLVTGFLWVEVVSIRLFRICTGKSLREILPQPVN